MHEVTIIAGSLHRDGSVALTEVFELREVAGDMPSYELVQVDDDGADLWVWGQWELPPSLADEERARFSAIVAATLIDAQTQGGM